MVPFVRSISLTLAALVLLAVAALPQPAHARWLRAESENFVIYSDGDESVLREYVRRLEIFHWILRGVTRAGEQTVVTRKLPIYLVDGNTDMRRINPEATLDTMGFYTVQGDGAYAVAERIRREDWVLFHEYAHHFMYQYFPGTRPAWYVEGYAEYFMTVEIERNRFTIGQYNESRAYGLGLNRWISLEELLRNRPGELEESWQVGAFYGQSWILTHWFHSDAGRNRNLHAYLSAVQDGADPVEAMTDATGLTMPELERTLRRYLNDRMLIATADLSSAPQAEVRIATLPPVYDQLLLESLRISRMSRDDDTSALLETIRGAAARYPDDPFARLTLARAELRLGDLATGTALLEALVEDRPEDLEALIHLAEAYRTMSETLDRREAVARLNQSNRLLVRALELDPQDFRVYVSIAENRRGEPTYPNDNDIELWLSAYDRAPQIPSIVLRLAEALMLASRFDEAQQVLGPLANSPHPHPASTRAAQLLEQAQAGQPPAPPPAQAESDPAEP